MAASSASVLGPGHLALLIVTAVLSSIAAAEDVDCTAYAREGHCETDEKAMTEHCPGECEKHGR